MKNLILSIAMFATFAFASCSSDDTESGDTDSADYNEQMKALLIGTWCVNDSLYFVGGERTSYNLTMTFKSDGTYTENLWWYWTDTGTVVGNESETNYSTGYYSLNNDVLYLSGHKSDVFSASGEYDIYELSPTELRVERFITYRNTSLEFSKQ